MCNLPNVNGRSRPLTGRAEVVNFLPGWCYGLEFMSVIFRVLLIVLLGSASPSQSAESVGRDKIVHEDPFANFRFPQTLGSYSYQGRVQYPRVGLGYGLNYVERSGATATIAIYDLNTTGVLDGTSDARVQQEFEKLDEVIASVAQQGGYQRAAKLANVPPLSKAWLQVNHELVRADGRRAYAYSFIRAQGGKFVKIRITSPSPAVYERLPMFLLDVSRSIGLLKPTAA
jgi:hypothetical protein